MKFISEGSKWFCQFAQGNFDEKRLSETNRAVFWSLSGQDEPKRLKMLFRCRTSSCLRFLILNIFYTAACAGMRISLARLTESSSFASFAPAQVRCQSSL